MSEIKNNDLNKALQDVRAAYRLLYAYHKRVRGILSIIEGRLSENGLTFWEWSPEYWGRPRRKLTPQNWNWDHFPFHSYSVWYSKDGSDSIPKKNDLIAQVIVESDTALSKCFKNYSEDHDVSKLLSIDDIGSNSQISIRLIHCDSYEGGETWNNESDWDNYVFLSNENGFTHYHKVFDLADLNNENEVFKAVNDLIESINFNSKQ